VRSVFLANLGCPKNRVDGEEILGRLVSSGWAVATDPENADVLLVNTCTFISDATKESLLVISELAELKRERSDVRLVVVGCLPQRFPEELYEELPEVDGFAGIEAAGVIESVLDSACRGCRVSSVGQPYRSAVAPLPRLRTEPRHVGYLKIADGCDHRCSFCVIPSVRGPFRSRELADVVEEARMLVDDGARELVLTAQDTSCYGTDLGSDVRLQDLLYALDDCSGANWIRILYAHPDGITPDLAGAIADIESVVPYLDMPVQHLLSPVLKRMGRRHDGDEIVRIVSDLRARVLDLALRTTILVGFPGETDEDFEVLMEGLSELRFERLGAFAYSREEGTAAVRLPDQVPKTTAHERLDTVMSLQYEIHMERNESLIGSTLRVMVDGCDQERDGAMLARTVHDAPEIDSAVVTPGVNREPGELLDVRVVATEGYDLIAEPDKGRTNLLTDSRDSRRFDVREVP
jgi:ribosomal protein S12 methylthiotransferase